MKHNTHIYIALKSIEWLYDSLSNLHYRSESRASAQRRSEARKVGKTLQRLLNYHKDKVAEASWAPDDILHDNALYHTFKLFTDREFTDCAGYAKETHTRNRRNYYRASGGGGLPYRVEHLARVIRDMSKLRDYNDSFSMEQMMYELLLLSHYVVDAHVPMHCDLRDDKPSSRKPSGGLYYAESWHGRVESWWDEACTPVAISEDLFDRERAQDMVDLVPLSEFVTFSLGSAVDLGAIRTYYIGSDDLMEFMINLCIDSKERSLRLFPVDNPEDFQTGIFNDLTREIFASCIGNLISVWVCIWA